MKTLFLILLFVSGILNAQALELLYGGETPKWIPYSYLGQINPSWTAEQQRLARKGDIGVRVKDFGAVGDGVTNDVTAFNNAIQAALTNSMPLKLEGKTYKLNSALNINGLDEFDFIDIVGDVNTVLDFKGAIGGDYKINISSSDTINLGAFTTLSNDTIVFSSTPNLMRGDVVIIADTSLFSFSTGSSTAQNGEYNEVRNVVGNTVLLARKLLEDYNDAKIVIYKAGMPKVRLQNITIKQDSSDNACGLQLSLCKNIILDNITLEQTLLSGMLLRNIYGGTINNIKGGYIRQVGSIYGTEYAVVVTASQDLIFDKLNLKSTRHAMSFGGGGDIIEVPNRNIKIVNSTFKSTNTTAALNTHQQVSNYLIDNCTIYNGCDMMGEYGKFTDNVVYMGNANYCLSVDRNRNTDFLIEGNTFKKDPSKTGVALVKLSSYNTYSPTYQYTPTFQYTGAIKCINNKFLTDGKTHSGLQIWAANDSVRNTNYIVEGNDFVGKSTYAISLLKSDSGAVGNLIINNNFIDSSCIYANTSRFHNLEITNNIIEYGEYPIYIISTDNPSVVTSKTVDISNNEIKSAKANNIYILLNDADTTLVGISNNKLFNPNVYSTYSNATSAAFIQVRNIDVLSFINNICGDLGFLDGHAKRIYGKNYYNNIGILYEIDNINIGDSVNNTAVDVDSTITDWGW